MAELIFLVAPVTLLYLLVGSTFASTFFFANDSALNAGGITFAFVIIGIFIALLWVAAVSFAYSKFEKIRDRPKIWRTSSLIACAFITLSWFITVTKVIQLPGDYWVVVLAGVFGTPLLIPTLHLLLESRRESR